jgi:hypothetical protein
MWMSEINGNPVALDTNSFEFFPLPESNVGATKKVLFEEYATAPCGFCPDGALRIEQMQDNLTDVIYATHHAGFGTDAMTIQAHSDYARAFVTGAPSGTVNRIFYDWQDINVQGQPDYEESTVGFNRGFWEIRTQNELNVNTPISIDVNVDQPSSDRLDITVSGSMVAPVLAENLRLNVFIVEDSVTGTGSGYDQINYYSSQHSSGGAGGPNHPYYNEPNPIVGYPHPDVVRAVLPSTWGQDISNLGNLNGIVTTGTTFNETFTYTIPSSFDQDQMSVIAYISHDGQGKDYFYQVLNADEVELRTATGIREMVSFDGKLRVFPNPANDMAYINIESNRTANAAVQVKDVTGRTVATVFEGQFVSGQANSLRLNTNSLENGMYFVEVISEGQRAVQRLQIAR